MNQVQFKVFLFLNGESKPEIRRFGINSDLVRSFRNVKAKLCEVFPVLQGKSFVVTWKDDENDDISISSDEELIIALTQMNIIKLNVVCNNEQNTQSASATTNSANGQGVHHGVLCDACDGIVVGYRYKCTSCDDYDLCARCEAAGLHPEHCMMRLPSTNLTRDLIRSTIKRSHQFLRTVVGPDSPGHKRKAHQRKMFAGMENRRTSWLDTLQLYMNEFADLTGDIESRAAAAKSAQAKAKKPAQHMEAEEDKNVNDRIKDVRKEVLNAMSYFQANLGQPKPSKEGNKNDKANVAGNEPPNTTPRKPDPSTSRAAARLKPIFADIIHKLAKESIAAKKAASTSVPTASTSVPTASTSVPTASSSVPTASSSVPTASSDVPTASTDVPTASTDDPTACADVVTTSTDVPTTKTGVKQDESKEVIPSSRSSLESDGSVLSGGQEKCDEWTMINNDLMEFAGEYEAAVNSASNPIGFKELHQNLEQQMRFEDYPPLNHATAVLKPTEGIQNTQSAASAATSAASAPTSAASAPTSAASAPTSAASAPTSAPADLAATGGPYYYNQKKHRIQTSTQYPTHFSGQNSTNAQAQAQANIPNPNFLYPNLNAAHAGIQNPPLRPHVAQALQQMMAMGFSNEDGWLSQLLDNKDGNIASVIDLLTPVQHNKEPKIN